MERKSTKRKKTVKFMPKKPGLFFDCSWGVFRVNGNNSFCYTTDKWRARLISVALNHFINSEDGDKWMAKNK